MGKNARRSPDPPFDPKKKGKKVKKLEETFPLLANFVRVFKWEKPLNVQQMLELMGEKDAEKFEHSLQDLYQSELGIYHEIDIFTERFCDLIKTAKASRFQGLQTYMVTDDLTVIPFCAVSVLSTLNNLKIPISDVKEVELQIGFKEGLSILKASLSSTSVLTDALLNHIPNKQVKREV